MKVVPWPSWLSHADRAAVQPDQLLHQRQADAAALVGAGRAPRDPVEALEQVRQLVRRDAGAGVGARSAAARSAGRGQRTVDRRRSKVNLRALREQVEDDLLPHLPVHVAPARAAAGSPRRASARPRSMAERKIAGQLGGEGGEVDRLEAGRDPAGLDAGEVQQGVDQLAAAAGALRSDQLELASRRSARRSVVGQHVLERARAAG